MTWAQVRGLNYSTMGRSVYGRLWTNGERTGCAWHVPPHFWRVENTEGEPAFLENDTDEFRRAADGAMVHAPKSEHRLVAWAGTAAWSLLTAHSQWPPTPSRFEPAGLTPAGAPQPVEVRGRRGWETRFTDSRTGEEVRWVIDAETGVALRRSTVTEVLEVTDPVLDEQFDPALFTWTGPTRTEQDEITAFQREHEEKTRRLREIPSPRVTWLPRTITTEPVDGDPRTGSLDLRITARNPYPMLRQWLTELGEPEPGDNTRHMPVVHRETRGPWTFELRDYTELAPADGARIIASLELADPPAEPPARIRATVEHDAAARAEAELRQALGTGRRLRDHLGHDHGASLLVRTAFGDDDAWRAVATDAMAPGHGPEPEFAANLICIDHPENEGLTIEALLEAIGDAPPYHIFLADHTTLTHPEHPILAVDTGPADTGHVRGQTVRVIPAQMWAIENNLALANLGFQDFVETADPDGIHRGFS